MGDDPQSLISYTQSKGILVQAYVTFDLTRFNMS